jgi:predicted MFS family arabinose efflux permease
MAFAADNIQPSKRSISMAIIGMGIGGAFLLSMVIAVPLANLVGLSGLFWLTVGLALLGMGLVITTPGSKRSEENDGADGESDMRAIWLLSLSVFLLHAVMTQLFVVLPGLWVDTHEFALAEHWKIYVPTMLGSILLILPILAVSGAKGIEQKLLWPAFGLLGLSMLVMIFSDSLLWLAGLLMAYFMAFNVLEASMPALVARFVGSSGRGKRMGLYSTFQFLGAFAGGVGGGWVLGQWGATAALASAAALCVLWGLVIGLLSKRVFRTSRAE